MKKSLIATAALAALVGAPAAAADLPVKAAFSSPPAYNWTGFYLGASGGYSFNRLNVNDVDFWNGFGDNSQHNNGFAIGGTVGYNWQVRSLVYGVEGDISYLSNNSTFNGNIALQPCAGCRVGFPFAAISSKIDTLATLRGRIGIAVDPALLYLTGGAAFGHVKNSYADIAFLGGPGTNGNLACPGCTAWTDSGWRAGWVFGAGVESALGGNWTAKVEALYYQLSDKTVSVAPYVTNGNANLAGAPFRQRFDDSGLIARVGVNYRFGGPIVANY